MAIRGVKPKHPAYLAVINGTPQPEGPVDPAAAVKPGYDNGLESPRKLAGRQLALWDRYVRRATWLTEFDETRAFMWVNLQAEFERRPQKMVAGKIAQLRALGSELGLDPSSRLRLGVRIDPPTPKKDPAEEFFE